jgi:aspartyl-tRNA(Asn)/glutamyl-tRNA(Gln) amidotransferase subunit C
MRQSGATARRDRVPEFALFDGRRSQWYAPEMTQRLSHDEVRHVARLARLRLPEEQVDAMRTELSSVLDHIAMLAKLDVSDAPPMAHPLDLVNRLDPDEPGPTLPLEALARIAPAMRDRFVDVPKILEDGGGGA